MLAQTDSTNVTEFVRKFRDRTTYGELARLRNGDIYGGIELCKHLEPGVGAPWRDIQIEHAKLNHGRILRETLDGILRQKDLDRNTISGALRLAGHIADPNLALPIETCWTSDDERINHLADYLWSFAQCCENDPARFLGPVCDAWAALPDKSEKMASRRREMN